MPSKNRVKIYAPDAYYHIYNRGVDKQNIFRSEKDYRIFEGLLSRYLSTETNTGKYASIGNEIELLSYSLMPNHFHMLIFQSETNAITKLGRRLITAYSMYFNKKYERIGPLFQDRFKAAMITEASHLWHISRYIHANPKELGIDPAKYEFSSYKDYLGERTRPWLKPQRILEMHQENNSNYQDFVIDYLVPS